MSSTKTARRGGIKGLLAVMASVAALGLAAPSPASADINFTLVSASMNQTYRANIAGVGQAVSNGITFQVAGYPGRTEVFAFCIDIFHHISLGPLGYTYVSNEDTGGGFVVNNGTTLVDAGGANPLDPLNQVSAIINLVDTGHLLHEATPNDAVTVLKLAAIQAAIWSIASPGNAVTLVNGGATAGGGTTYQQYFDDYRTGNYTSLADANDQIFTIRDFVVDGPNSRSHQTFAVGWPIHGVPEPETWALMLVGFGGAGAMVRANRRRQAVAA